MLFAMKFLSSVKYHLGISLSKLSEHILTTVSCFSPTLAGIIVVIPTIRVKNIYGLKPVWLCCISNIQIS